MESCIVSAKLGGECEISVKNIKNLDTKTATPHNLKNMADDDTADEMTALMRKIEAVGKQLKEWDVEIYRGILTGFNEAFVIDGAKRDELIKKDPKSAEIIKPILRGRDVQKYATNYAGLWLINSHNNPPVNIDEYQALKEHLDGFYDKLEKRGDRGKTPYNLRNCAYLADFEKPKIVWGEISDKPKFAYDDGDFYVEATSFIMVGESLKFLLGVLNSKLSKWYFERISTTTGMGTNRWKKFKLELLPIAVPKDEKPFIDLVDKILKAKKSGGDTSELEGEIDVMVYKLYNLTQEEIDIVEGIK